MLREGLTAAEVMTDTMVVHLKRDIAVYKDSIGDNE